MIVEIPAFHREHIALIITWKELARLLADDLGVDDVYKAITLTLVKNRVTSARPEPRTHFDTGNGVRKRSGGRVRYSLCAPYTLYIARAPVALLVLIVGVMVSRIFRAHSLLVIIPYSGISDRSISASVFARHLHRRVHPDQFLWRRCNKNIASEIATNCWCIYIYLEKDDFFYILMNLL